MTDDNTFRTMLLEHLKDANPALYSLLKACEINLNGSKTIIGFHYSFHYKKMSDPKFTYALGQAIEGLTGNPVDLSMVMIQPAEVKNDEARIEDGVEDERIYLEHVHVSNFRALDDISISLNPKVNVIIGANNAGKSALVDALRLALQVGRYKKAAYVSLEDFKDITKEIEIDLKFHCPSTVKGIPELKTFEKHSGGIRSYLELHIRYYVTGTEHNRQVRQRFWGGNSGGRVPDDEALEIFSFEYLSALRDAKMVLRPSSRSKIAELLLNLRLEKIDRKKIEEVFEKAQRDPEIIKLINEASGSVESHLSKIALRNDDFNINLQPLPPEYEELVGSFEMKLIKDILIHTIAQNGLGYNNVLYAATVLGHIKSAQKRDPEQYHALIIEEPEAHLHPQLEDSLFSYISDLGNGIGSQVIVTTHSPIISSTTNIDNIIILHKEGSLVRAVNLSNVALDVPQKKKLSRYLDVTKSQLFFAKSVIFVEGITEELLLPVLADVHFQEKDSLISRGIEVVNIGGVSFEPYAKLFNSVDFALPKKAVIITDKDDPYKEKDGTEHTMSARAENALELKGHNLEVSLSDYKTFECDLWHAGNSEVMKQAGEPLFPRSELKAPEDLLRVMDNSSKFGKGDLAQEIIEVGTTLKVPDYIRIAFEWVSNDNAN